MKKILSIIIPTYNMEDYLNYCLSSLLIKEGLEMVEVLVINDGSKDSSLKIAIDFEARYPETFRVIDKENGNYGSCINRGLQEATGKYVKILDADDSFDTEAFATLVSALTQYDADMFITDFVTVNSSREETSHSHRPLPTGEPIDSEDLFAVTHGSIINMHEITYRTENLRAMGYKQTEGISYTDMEWTMMPLSSVRDAYYIDIPVYRYLVGRVGQTIDPKVAARSQSQAEKTLFVQIDALTRLHYSGPNMRKHIYGHVEHNTKMTYRAYLVDAYEILKDDGLIALDDRLKTTNPEVYERMNDQIIHPRIPLHFIRRWRENDKKATASIKLYRTFVFPLLRKLKLG